MSADNTAARRSESNHRERHLRLGPTDPRTRVVPARPDPVHRAIVITCLAVMTLAAIVGGTVSMAGRLTTRGGVTLGLITLAGIGIMSAADWYFRRANR